MFLIEARIRRRDVGRMKKIDGWHTNASAGRVAGVYFRGVPVWSCGMLVCEAPLYHFNGPIGYDSDNRNIVHVLDTHEKFCRRPSSLAHARQWIATTAQHFWRTTWTFSLRDAVRAVAYLTSDYLNDRQQPAGVQYSRARKFRGCKNKYLIKYRNYLYLMRKIN